MNNLFIEGQKVIFHRRGKENYSFLLENGYTGTVIDSKRHINNGFVGIKFDSNIGGHDCNKACEVGYGYYCLKEDLDIFLPVNTRIKQISTGDTGIIIDIIYDMWNKWKVYNIKWDKDNSILYLSHDNIIPI